MLHENEKRENLSHLGLDPASSRLAHSIGYTMVASAVAGIRECSMRKSVGKPRFGASDLLYEQVRITDGRLAKAHPH